jgi:hypothetical protein
MGVWHPAAPRKKLGTVDDEESRMQRRTTLTALAALGAAASCRTWALYDPKPHDALALAPGAWQGTLTYRDWSNPDKQVTLPCRLAVALTQPDELALYYVFDDGPGKTVYSYDRMRFDFAASRLAWASGTAKPSMSEYRVTAVQSNADEAQLLFERSVEGRLDKYTFDLARRTWRLSKREVAANGAETLRNRYELVRSAA